MKSGDDAFREVAAWAEKEGRWDQTVVILTADHGHYLVIDEPDVLIPPPSK
ncbi:MAG: sulfatase-like hydrolase/transferase [Pirellulales bacterium]